MLLSVLQKQDVAGFSCAFSVVDYLLLKKRHNIPDCEVWSCTGTPVDCVKLALDRFLLTESLTLFWEVSIMEIIPL